MHYKALQLDKLYQYALPYLRGLIYRHLKSYILSIYKVSKSSETLNNIKSNYMQNGMKYGLRNMENRVGNVRGHITYKEVPEED